jgi:hypothetical protein
MKLDSANTNIDPFFADKNCYTGETPSDLSLNHDQYLYEE